MDAAHEWMLFFQRVKMRPESFYQKCLKLLEAQDLYEPDDLATCDFEMLRRQLERDGITLGMMTFLEQAAAVAQRDRQQAIGTVAGVTPATKTTAVGSFENNISFASDEAALAGLGTAAASHSLPAEEKARTTAVQDARLEAEAEARRKANEEEARRKTEEARRKADEEARKEAEVARRKADEEEARRKIEEARRKADEEARKEAEEARRKADEEEARRKTEEEARRKADELRIRTEDAVRKRAEIAMMPPTHCVHFRDFASQEKTIEFPTVLSLVIKTNPTSGRAQTIRVRELAVDRDTSVLHYDRHAFDDYEKIAFIDCKTRVVLIVEKHIKCTVTERDLNTRWEFTKSVELKIPAGLLGCDAHAVTLYMRPTPYYLPGHEGGTEPVRCCRMHASPQSKVINPGCPTAMVLMDTDWANPRWQRKVNSQAFKNAFKQHENISMLYFDTGGIGVTDRHLAEYMGCYGINDLSLEELQWAEQEELACPAVVPSSRMDGDHEAPTLEQIQVRMRASAGAEQLCCPICMSDEPLDNIVFCHEEKASDAGRTHFLCKDCMGGHLHYEVHDNMRGRQGRVQCPCYNADGGKCLVWTGADLGDEALNEHRDFGGFNDAFIQRNVRDPATYKLFEDLATFALIEQQAHEQAAQIGETVVYCKNPQCNNIFFARREAQRVECTYCEAPEVREQRAAHQMKRPDIPFTPFSFCNVCDLNDDGETFDKNFKDPNAPVHKDKNCEEYARQFAAYKTAMKEDGGVTQMVEGDPVHFRKCPWCSRAPPARPVYHEKITGCNKMTCPMSRRYWCWTCSRKLPSQNPYGHFSDGSGCTTFEDHGPRDNPRWLEDP